MNKEQLLLIDPSQKTKMAVAYLVKNKQERPEGLEKLFSKLDKYEMSMHEIMRVIDNTKKSLDELTAKGDQMLGSIESIAELISEDLPKEKIEEWCSKYKFPERLPNNIQMAGAATVKKVENVDMAGSTSKLIKEM